jgi:hypothetical protein
MSVFLQDARRKNTSVKRRSTDISVFIPNSELPSIIFPEALSIQVVGIKFDIFNKISGMKLLGQKQPPSMHMGTVIKVLIDPACLGVFDILTTATPRATHISENITYNTYIFSNEEPKSALNTFNIIPKITAV